MGVAALNEEIEQSLSTALPAFHPRGDTYVGRPFLVRRNDYALGLFNGDSGVIVSAPEPGTSHALAALRNSDGSVRLLSLARLPDHETCFAMTIHKSQGSQFEHTIVVLPDHLSPIVTRELVYTAVTRASQQLTLTASEGVLREALGTQVRRSSGLGPILWVET